MILIFYSSRKGLSFCIEVDSSDLNLTIFC